MHHTCPIIQSLWVYGAVDGRTEDPLTYRPTVTLVGVYPREMKVIFHTCTSLLISFHNLELLLSSFLHNTQTLGPPTCPSIVECLDCTCMPWNPAQRIERLALHSHNLHVHKDNHI